jgi:polyphenol oxidase
MMKNYFIPDWPAPASVRALITTRVGGVSELPYAGNNLAAHVGDDIKKVERNREQLCRSVGLIQPPQWLMQIHGVRVVNSKADCVVRTADGSYTDKKNLACSVLTADCLPILLCNKQGTEVAALHCGWKSLAKGICARGIAKFTSEPKDLMAYFGPAISQKHFEVGVDVLNAFFKLARNSQQADATAKAFNPTNKPFHFHADIYALARAELNALGVEKIFGGLECTYTDETHYYSFRRDNVTGRMASLIWLQ